MKHNLRKRTDCWNSPQIAFNLLTSNRRKNIFTVWWCSGLCSATTSWNVHRSTLHLNFTHFCVHISEQWFSKAGWWSLGGSREPQTQIDCCCDCFQCCILVLSVSERGFLTSNHWRPVVVDYGRWWLLHDGKYVCSWCDHGHKVTTHIWWMQPGMGGSANHGMCDTSATKTESSTRDYQQQQPDSARMSAQSTGRQGRWMTWETDRQASHQAHYLPVPEWRCILNAVSTAGPSSKNRHTEVMLENV